MFLAFLKRGYNISQRSSLLLFTEQKDSRSTKLEDSFTHPVSSITINIVSNAERQI